ncbi:DUF47 domain-containing protein [bacterium CG_4_9_14_3_um_filter_65_15]|nr:MAG: DUF47 domain-containing protein [bacterium CG_4_9_14_3_um_filter_65_15]
MPLFKRTREIESQIDEFLDNVAEGVLYFQEGVAAFLEGSHDEFAVKLESLDRCETQADTLSRDVEASLYSNSLIPEHRGDVLGLLENTDNIIDRAKLSLHQFALEAPVIPEQFHAGFNRLAVASCRAGEEAVMAARAFFRDVQAVKDHLYKVHHFEGEADQYSEQLKREIFLDSALDLAHQTQLRYFAHNVEKVSDEAESVADRLAIYSIKRTI